MKILILGGGPAGLGAAWRLNELGNNDWHLLEANHHAGGLASSFRDKNGFFWDIGGHVQFSHYEYFDRLMHDFIPPEQWLTHQRESWVWMRGRFVPYPFQNNIRRLPQEDLARCLQGLVELYKNGSGQPKNFEEWIYATFGRGIAEAFMLPYNFKVWAYPAKDLAYNWVGERVAVADLARILDNLVFEKDDLSWGPNNVFQFPKHGGTGAIWNACAKRLPPDRLHFSAPVEHIDSNAHAVTTSDGHRWPYDALISTIPLTELLLLTRRPELAGLGQSGLRHSSSNIIGLGLKGQPPEHLKTKCWMYFPEADCPFYRVTVFSNYSPHNVPDSRKTWSLMTETSESANKPVRQETLLQDTIRGLINTKLLREAGEIVSTWSYRARYGYPIPGLHRDETLAKVLPALEANQIYSRGRFGGWKYEVSNQDHSFMQGLEIIERLLSDRPEITFPDPNHANSKKHPFPFERWQN